MHRLSTGSRRPERVEERGPSRSTPRTAHPRREEGSTPAVVDPAEQQLSPGPGGPYRRPNAGVCMTRVARGRVPA